MMPAVAAVYTPRPSKKEYTKLEVLRDALNVPGFLDHLIATCLFLDYSLYEIQEKQAGAAAGKKIAGQMHKIGHEAGGDGGSGEGGGGGGDSGGFGGF